VLLIPNQLFDPNCLATPDTSGIKWLETVETFGVIEIKTLCPNRNKCQTVIMKKTENIKKVFFVVVLYQTIN
jgi:hypothetical protein